MTRMAEFTVGTPAVVPVDPLDGDPKRSGLFAGCGTTREEDQERLIGNGALTGVGLLPAPYVSCRRNQSSLIVGNGGTACQNHAAGTSLAIVTLPSAAVPRRRGRRSIHYEAGLRQPSGPGGLRHVRHRAAMFRWSLRDTGSGRTWWRDPRYGESAGTDDREVAGERFLTDRG